MDETKNYENFPKGSDPSDLTTQLVLREVASLKELLFSEIQAMKEAIKVAHNDLVRVPTDVQEAVRTLKDLHEEKFNSIKQRFLDMADLRNEKLSGIQKQVDTQEKIVNQQYLHLVESINKSDAASNKLIDQQGLLIINSKKSTDDKIDDLKDRFGKIDNLLTASLSEGSGKNQGYRNIGANVGTIISIITLIIVLISFALKFSGKTA